VTYRTLPDGTRLYSNYVRYKPKAPEERVYGVRRPDDPRAVRFHGTWFLPMDLLPMGRRYMPETRPDDQTLEHRALCQCHVCKRPQAAILWARRRNRLP
jgi:hypothetical protein